MKLSFKSFWQEFKGFAFKGNMIDLAVAVVIGGAFTGVINSLVGDIIMPAISYVTTAAHEVSNTATDLAHEATGHGKSPGPAPATTQASASQPVAAPASAAPSPAPSATPASPTSAVNFSWKVGRFEIGHFIASLINFTIIAFAVFLMMVKLLGSVVKRASQSSEPAEPTTKECPECLSIIPYKAKRCSQCTAILMT